MARRYRTTFVATGTFPFPIDMMRYDRCTPNSERDSGRIQHSFERQGEREEYQITVRHESEEKGWRPTFDRWRSFGYRITKIDEERIS